MTKLEQLIKELCPEGVEYCKLGEICSLVTGATPSKVKNDYWENGTIPWMSSGEVNNKIIYDTEQKITQLGYDSASTTIVPVHSIVIALAGQGKTRGKVAITEIELCTNQSLCSMICGERIFYKFLYYYLDSKYLELREISNGDGARGGLSLKILSPYKVPVPPIEVQYEIVRILDNFTEVTVELTEKLTAELTARKKQYEYYRDELLKPKADIPMVTLGEIATDIFRGAGIKKDEVTNEGIPCVRYGEIYTTYHTWFTECVSHTKLEHVQSPKWFEHGDILFAITGESVEDIATSVAYIGNEKCLAGGDIVVMKHNQNPRYLAYVLATQAARAQKSKGKVKSKVVHSSVPSIQQISIPLPPLDVQEHYANVLDNFEAICTDLNIGLPAEIEARQKQYEYYRDKLLTFKEKEA